jgi:pilus assembly protein CpaC
MVRSILCRGLRPLSMVVALVCVLAARPATPADPPRAQPPAVAAPGAGSASASIVYKVQGMNERLQLIVNTSRILTLGQKIPQAQVNNPDILELHALSPTEVQISARKAGVTQVNLWGEDQKIYSLDVVVYGDAQELNMIIRQEFPNSTVRATPLAGGVLLSGYVDQPEHISRIVQIAEEFYPKVLNNMTVGGVQLVLLHVKVMEVSRTKLRNLGVDWATITNGAFVVSSVSGLISSWVTDMSSPITTAANETFAFNIVGRSGSFFGVLEALRQDNLAKLLADPTLVTISGRSAFFSVGGEFPIMVPESLGTVAIEYKKFGTQIDFVPVVLGNGRIHLDVRPRVSEIDPTRSVTINGTTVPGLRTREVETGLEMNAGQTLAIAGLVQSRDEAENRGMPWVSELPYLGVFFRRVHHQYNEIELLILVTPELVDAVNPQDMPPCGPGSRTTRPSDCDLFFRGHLEVPNCCPTCTANGCPACAQPGTANRAPGQEPGLILDNGRKNPAASPASPSAAETTAAPTASFKIDHVTTGGGVTPTEKPAPPANQQKRYPRAQSPDAAPATADRSAAPAFLGPTGYQAR